MIKTALYKGMVCAVFLGCSLEAAIIIIGNPPLSATGNCDPFGCAYALGLGTYQQVYSHKVFPSPQLIQMVTFYNSEVANDGDPDQGTYTLSFSYTNAVPGQPAPPAGNGLDLTDPNNNISGGSQLFYTGPLPSLVNVTGGRTLNFTGTPFAYDPSMGNLLLTITVTNPVDAHPTLYLNQAASLTWTTNAYFGTSNGGDDVGGLVTGFIVSGVLQITGPNPLPPAVVGMPYAVTFMAVGGTGGYTWSATGLPAGLSMSVAGVLSGTPSPGSQNTYKPQFTVTDSSGTHASGTETLIVNPQLMITGPTALPSGAVAVPYGPVTFTAIGGTGGYTWSATGLPTGLSMSAAGVLSGTPAAGTQSNSYNPKFKVTDSSNVKASVTLPLIIKIAALKITGPASLPNGAVAESYGPVTFTATGGTGVYTWSATGLPTGLSMSTGGMLSGKPAKGSQRSYNPQFTIIDSRHTQKSVSLPLTIQLLPLQITGPASLPNGTVNVAYGPVTFTASGGTGGYNWSATGLPKNLIITAGGMLKGTPAPGANNTYAPRFTVTDSSLTKTSATLTLIINPPALKIVGPAMLSTAFVNVSYGPVNFAASGGTGIYTWSATGLPSGLSMSTGGALSGMPASGSSQQSYNPQFTVMDSGNSQANVTLPLAVNASLTTLYSFAGGSDGANPRSTLTADSSGALYGATTNGGAAAAGAVFQLTPPVSGGSWTESVIYSFLGGADGANPFSNLVFDSSGAAYGTTSAGGSTFGTVFQLTPPVSGGTWTETVLYSFTGGSDGSYPAAGLLPGPNGVFYSATTGGGSAGFGTVFQMTPPSAPGGPWTESVLYSFLGGSDGAYPPAGLIMDPAGVLYGTTSNGGNPACTNGCGAVFALTPPAPPGGAWTETVLYSFSGGSDGATPTAGLLLGSDGALYGTASSGGTSTAGTVFKLTPPASGPGPWTETVLYSFAHQDGANPYSTLLLAPNGGIWGTTLKGGTSNGTVFELMPTGSGGTWVETALDSFAGGSGGAHPAAGLLLDASGVLYGTTMSGGSAGTGTVFQVTP